MMAVVLGGGAHYSDVSKEPKTRIPRREHFEPVTKQGLIHYIVNIVHGIKCEYGSCHTCASWWFVLHLSDAVDASWKYMSKVEGNFCCISTCFMVSANCGWQNTICSGLLGGRN